MIDAYKYRIAFLNWAAEQIAAGRTSLDLRRAVNEGAEWNGLIPMREVTVQTISDRGVVSCRAYMDGILDAIEMMEGRS